MTANKATDRAEERVKLINLRFFHEVYAITAEEFLSLRNEVVAAAICGETTVGMKILASLVHPDGSNTYRYNEIAREASR